MEELQEIGNKDGMELLCSDFELQIQRLLSEFSLFRVRINIELVACAARRNYSGEIHSQLFAFGWTTLSSKK